jgi:hypothetical protein
LFNEPAGIPLEEQRVRVWLPNAREPKRGVALPEITALDPVVPTAAARDGDTLSEVLEPRVFGVVGLWIPIFPNELRPPILEPLSLRLVQPSLLLTIRRR